MDALIQTYADDFMEKIYYFCLHKAGGAAEAEDLTSDISLCVISELRRGVEPENFAAWVWRIARNRYARWAETKRKLSESVSGADIDTLDLYDELNIEEGIILAEDLSLMRRELAFIQSEYRNVLVAYYIDYRSVGDIAASMKIPVGTVKTKLFRSRNILKEGMNMSREFGNLSYNPANINFVMNGRMGSNGEPWAIIKRKICKNILIAAYKTPSTAEQLAMELGIALPYMEDELEKLVDATLMRKNGNKYETAFFIVSAAAQAKIDANLRTMTSAVTEKVIELNEYQAECYEKNGTTWHEGYQPYDDVKWAMLMISADNLGNGTCHDSPKDDVKPNSRPARPNSGNWDITGFEEYSGEKPSFVGFHVNNYDEGKFSFNHFKFNYKGISDKTPAFLSYQDELGLVAAAKGDTSGINDAILDKLTEFGYLKKAKGKFIPACRVTFKDKTGELTAEQAAKYDEIYREACAILKDHYIFCRDTINCEIPGFLKNDRYSIDTAYGSTFEIRGAILEEALRTGYITYPGDESRVGMLGAYLTL